MLWIEPVLWVSTHCAIVSKLMMAGNKEWIVGKELKQSEAWG